MIRTIYNGRERRSYVRKQWQSVEVELLLPDPQGEPTIQLDRIAGRLDWAKSPVPKLPLC